jgi:cytochrome P450
MNSPLYKLLQIAAAPHGDPRPGRHPHPRPGRYADTRGGAGTAPHRSAVSACPYGPARHTATVTTTATGAADALPGTDREAVAYRLPDLTAPFPRPLPRSDHRELREHTCRWAEEHGVIGPRGRDRLLGSEHLDLGLAMTGSAHRDRAAVLLDWFLWMLLLDDRIDNGPWAHGGALTGFADAVCAELVPSAVPLPTRRARPDAAEPMTAVLRDDLWPRTAALAGPQWQQRFAAHLRRHLLAQRRLVDHPRAHLTRAAYVPLRRALFGADVFFDLMEALDGAAAAPSAPPVPSAPSGAGAVPGPTGLPPALRVLREAAADTIAWTNDLYSVEKDLAFGETANLVLVLRHERGLGWQEAVDAAGDAVARRTADFRRAARLVPGSFARRLGETVRASLDWHRASARYRQQPAPAAAPAATPAAAPAAVTDGGPPPTADRTVADRTAADREPAAPGIVDGALIRPSMLWPECERDPYTFYEMLRDRFPVTYDEPLDTWLLSRHEDVRAALSDPRFSSANYQWQLAPVIGPTIMQMDGAEHTRHRALLSPAFRGDALARLRETVDRTARELVAEAAARLRDGETVDLVAAFTRPLPTRTIISVLGLPPADEPDLVRWYQGQIAFLSNDRQDPGALARGLAMRAELGAYLDEHIARRRARPTGDLLSTLCHATVSGAPLPDDHVKGFCANILAAGSESTDKSLASYLVNLLENPAALRAVRDDPAGTSPRAWAESLRRNPTFHVVTRQTTEPVDLPHGRIPGGAVVGCLVASANRDPGRFPDPDRYDPDRFREPGTARQFTAASAHLTFGAGRHFCIGAQLSLMEAELGVGALLRAVPGLRWAPGFTPTETGRLVRAPERLLVTAP